MGAEHLTSMNIEDSTAGKDFRAWVTEVNMSIIGGQIMALEECYASLVKIALNSIFRGKRVGGNLVAIVKAMAQTSWLDGI